MKIRPFQYFLGSILILLISIPLFFYEGGIYNSMLPDDRGLPVSIIIILATPLLVFKSHNKVGFFYFIIIANSLIIPFVIYGLFEGYYFSAVLIGAYMIPLIAGYSYSIFCRDFISELGLQKVMVGAATAISVVSIAWLSFQIQNIVTMGRADGSVWDIFVIYQVWVYWPTVLAIFFCFQTGYKGYLVKFNQFVLAISILATGAREPILFCLAFYIFYFASKRDVKRLKLLIYSTLVFLILILIVYLYFPDSIIADKIGDQITGRQDLSAGRLEVIEQFRWLDISPFIGTGFSDAGIFGSPHNQYLEIFYRGGILSTLGLAIIFLIIFFREGQSQITKIVLLTLLLISFNINTPLRSPYAAVIFWFLFFSNLKDTSRRNRYVTNHTRPILRQN